MTKERLWRLANERAHNRLLASMNETQRKTYLEEGWFEVVSNLGHHWHIDGQSHINNCTRINPAANRFLARARVTPAMRRIRVFLRPVCAHLDPYTTGTYVEYPMEDHLLAQALTIRTDEEAFILIASGMW